MNKLKPTVDRICDEILCCVGSDTLDRDLIIAFLLELMVLHIDKEQTDRAPRLEDQLTSTALL